MKITILVLAFICQPVFWIGIIRSYLNGKHRIRRTRRQFNTSIYDYSYELYHFWIGTFIFGIFGSIIALLFGLHLSLELVTIYELLLIINLIIVPGNIFPISLALVSSIFIGLINITINSNYLLFSSLLILANGIFMLLNGGKFNVPKTYHNQRDNRTPGYPFKELSVFPMLIFIPGNVIKHFLSFWPTFTIGHQEITFILLPVLLGMRFTVFKHLPKRFFIQLSKRVLILGGFGILLSLISYFYVNITMVSLFILLILYWIIIFSMKHVDKKNGILSSEAVNGIRVIGIEPNTPAAKMNINVGDIIVSANRIPVTNENDFYRALLKYPTYCHLKLLNRENRLKITETAIFNNSPHEIGIILFKNY